MSSKKLKFKKGEEISLNGQGFKFVKPCTLDVIPTSSSNTQAQEQPKGEHQSDDSQAVAKDEVLSLIQKQIDALESHEDDILNGGILSTYEYPLEDEDNAQVENFSVAAHATIAAQIIDLKKMLKTVSNL